MPCARRTRRSMHATLEATVQLSSSVCQARPNGASVAETVGTSWPGTLPWLDYRPLITGRGLTNTEGLALRVQSPHSSFHVDYVLLMHSLVSCPLSGGVQPGKKGKKPRSLRHAGMGSPVSHGIEHACFSSSRVTYAARPSCPFVWQSSTWRSGLVSGPGTVPYTRGVLGGVPVHSVMPHTRRVANSCDRAVLHRICVSLHCARYI